MDVNETEQGVHETEQGVHEAGPGAEGADDDVDGSGPGSSPGPGSGSGSDGQTKEQVMETLVELLTEVVGEDYLFDMEITDRTAFATDLELESIEFVALSEKLQQRYANRVDFVTWMGDMGVEQIMALRVGDLADHIVESLAAGDS